MPLSLEVTFEQAVDETVDEIVDEMVDEIVSGGELSELLSDRQVDRTFVRAKLPCPPS